MRVELPDGQWADLLDPADLRAGDLKTYRKLMPVPGARDYVMEDLDTARDGLLTRLIQNWSLDLPLPGEDPASLDKLTVPAYRALLDELGPYMDLFNGVEPDPKSSPESAGTSADSESSSTSTS